MVLLKGRCLCLKGPVPLVVSLGDFHLLSRIPGVGFGVEGVLEGYDDDHLWLGPDLLSLFLSFMEGAEATV